MPSICLHQFDRSVEAYERLIILDKDLKFYEQTLNWYILCEVILWENMFGLISMKGK